MRRTPGLVRIERAAAPPPGPGIVGSAVDAPCAGTSVDAGAMEVVGWVLGEQAPVTAVEILDGDDVVAREPVDGERIDLLDGFPEVPWAVRAGYRTTVAFRRPVSDMRLTVRAVLHDGSVQDVGTLAGRRSWRDDPIEGAPLVSVVIPCYDQAHFLRDAIESVLAQTYPNVEVLVVDDGSADNTEALVDHYEGVRCVRQENVGLAGARNTGIRRTIGPFLIFLDADDRLLPEAVDAGIECFRSDPPAAFVYGACRFIGTDGSPIFTPDQLCSDEPYLSLLEMCGIIPGSVMFRRAVFDGGRGFDSTLDASADWDMYLRVARELPVRCHGRTVLEYRRHADNMTNDHARILDAEMAVLRRHRELASGVPGGRHAVAAGMARARRTHGPAVAADVRRAAAAGDARTAAARAWLLARTDPRGVRHLVRRRP